MFTYNLAEGLITERDEVRLLIGDTVEEEHNLEDEEIDFFLREECNKYFAAAAAANALMQKLAGGYFEDQKVGETRLRTKRINELKILVDQLRQRGMAKQLPSSGGLFKSETDAMLSTNDIRDGDFFRGMHDMPATTKRSRNSRDLFE